MKKPATRLFRVLAAGLLSASLTTGCSTTVFPTVKADTPTAAPVITDFVRIAPTGPVKPPQPTLHPKVVVSVTPKPIAILRPSTRSISGNATYYAYVVGGAAAGPGLRAALGLHWRHQNVTVCATTCVRVTLSDWCLCKHGNRLIDLDSRSFARLAPLSQGIVKVTIKW